jgi:hypothetical protein
MQLFNQKNADIVLFMKIACNTTAISSAFFAIRHFPSHRILAILCLLLVLDALVIFIGLYNSTFSIPQDFKKTKKQLIIGARRLLVRRQRELDIEKAALMIVREVASVRPLGVKVGDFRQLERQSTPNFVMFVLFNTGRVLVTFK